ncbi:MAG: MerR family transcriptional regulator [Firmicutes bacterium]|nr:MerR family transcriptional regulator [Bacillota bacterium]
MEKKYKIHEVAEFIGVSPSLIRYYEEKGLIEIEKDPENGYRTFSEADIFKIWLVTFHRAIHMGLGDIDTLIRGTSLEQTRRSVGVHREKTLRILEQAKRDLDICDLYDRYIERSQREGELPLVFREKTFYLYDQEDFFHRRKPSFPACTLGSVFEQGEEKRYSAVYEEDLYILSDEERDQCCEKWILRDMLSYVVSVDSHSFGADALKKALCLAKEAGYDVCEPYYTFYQLSLCEENDLEYRYEVLLSLQKGS